VATLFATLESGFFTVVQVVVYVGAIAILIIFAVMLTGREMQDTQSPVNRNALLAGLVSLAVFAGIIAALSAWSAWGTARPEFAGEDIAELGRALVSPDGFMIPFEVASVLLVGALIGAIYVAGDQQN
jgi:NADH-quinone oxidoreductase subunit J